MTLLIHLLQQETTRPQWLSAELLAILTAIGGFMAAQVWPWLRARLDKDYAYRREREKSVIDDAKARDIVMAESLKSLAQSMDLLARTQATQAIYLSQIHGDQERAAEATNVIATHLSVKLPERRRIHPKKAEEPK